ncbi:hypothetical protein AMELA_G00005730 [Ameiurus melas]|uniref:Uncharacterized protein n=1 Tax=Ameiurus melas TaxID=219545 RepID=A0A7J6BHT8_AMEME|nr:hypothetical protein AMELA_G00005730 [Ameiurus melas]
MRCQLKEPANQKKPSQSEETEENLSSAREAIAEGSLQLRERRSETSDSLIEEKLISPMPELRMDFFRVELFQRRELMNVSLRSNSMSSQVLRVGIVGQEFRHKHNHAQKDLLKHFWCFRLRSKMSAAA